MKNSFSRAAIDEKDIEILRVLQKAGRISNSELAERVALSASPCWKRLRRLESTGLIRGYKAVLNRHLLGLGTTVFVSILLENHTEATCREFERRVSAFPEVIACHNVSGQYDYLLHVLTNDMESYSQFALKRLRSIPGVKEMHSVFSLREVKADGDLSFD
ncbi:MAG: Lrp/AsnC family transcriptional regulator [Burkholderiaceae bacterium]